MDYMGIRICRQSFTNHKLIVFSIRILIHTNAFARRIYCTVQLNLCKYYTGGAGICVTTLIQVNVHCEMFDGENILCNT